jgi:hypothetical protein
LSNEKSELDIVEGVSSGFNSREEALHEDEDDNER